MSISDAEIELTNMKHERLAEAEAAAEAGLFGKAASKLSTSELRYYKELTRLIFPLEMRKTGKLFQGSALGGYRRYFTTLMPVIGELVNIFFMMPLGVIYGYFIYENLKIAKSQPAIL